jgi:hypothetical protein
MRWAVRVKGWRGAHATPHESHSSSARPRVTRAVQAAQMAHAGVKRGMGNAMFGLEALLAAPMPMAQPVTQTSASLGSAMALRLPPALVRDTTRAAWLTGRRPEDVLTEALADWMAGYESAPAAPAAPSPMRASGRQHSWGEIEETLRALRAS